MHSHRRTGVIVVLLIITYVGTLRTLELSTPSDGNLVAAQGYPNLATTAQAGYPPPPAAPPATRTSRPANTPHPTSTPRPTRTSMPASPTVTSTSTARVLLTPTRTPAVDRGQAQASPTVTPAIRLPTTVTRRGVEATPTPTERPVAPTLTAPAVVSETALVSLPQAASPAPPAVAPPMDVLPPVADHQTEPGTVPTLLAGALLAVLAWWVWHRWLISPDTAETDDAQDQV